MNKPLRLYLMLFPILALYGMWEFYWAIKVGSLFIKWHTHLALYIYMAATVSMFVTLINHFNPLKNFINLQLSTVVFFGACIVLEATLITMGIGDTYMERIKYGYVSRYGSNHEDYYRLHKPNEVFYMERPEFKYIRHCNSLGFSDMEWPVTKKNGEKRILVLGDSFTEGVGAPADSCYPSALSKLLADTDSNITVMNAGIAGNDPCVNFVTYRDLLLKYKPDVIIQSLSSNDMNTDIATKGGMERFQKDGSVKFRKAPWWEPIFAISYISRLYFNARGYNELLIKTPFEKREKQQLDAKAIELFRLFATETEKQGSKLIVILQPDQGALYQKKFEYDLSAVKDQMETSGKIKVIDLLPIYLQHFAGKENSIKNYYWQNDGHHNACGYAVMAQCVKTGLDSLYIYENR